MSQDARLLISRNDPRDVKFREILMLLDGKEVANLKYGQSTEIATTPGPHSLQAFNRMLKSPAIELRLGEGESASFSTGNIPNGCFGFLMILQMAPPSPFLQRIESEP